MQTHRCKHLAPRKKQMTKGAHLQQLVDEGRSEGIACSCGVYDLEALESSGWQGEAGHKSLLPEHGWSLLEGGKTSATSPEACPWASEWHGALVLSSSQ